MDRAAFERELQTQGYGEIVDRRMEPNHVNPEHTHEFDARVMVLEGAITIGRDGGAQTFRAGEMCAITAGTLHTEQCGAEGVRYLAGRRYKS
jgi:quercetin dioxygenase-like cupin family protein